MTHPARFGPRDDRRTRHVGRQDHRDENQRHYREGGARRNHHRVRHGAVPHPIARHRVRGCGQYRDRLDVSQVGRGRHPDLRGVSWVARDQHRGRRDACPYLHARGCCRVGATRMEPTEC
jgi:hypothetical protein